MSDPQTLDPRTKDFLKSLDERIERRRTAVTPEVSGERWAFREAAAVLVAFDLGTLRPLADPDVAESTSAVLLLPDIVLAPQSQPRRLYMLSAEVRKAALARLQARHAVLAALEANPDRARDEFQALLELWLAQTPPPLDSQHYSELITSAQIAAWLDGIVPNVPSPGEVQRRINRRSVYALFEHLASADFTGRVTELRQLREYVGVLEPSTLSDSLRRQLHDWLGERPRPPLAIIGAGGVGKSALLGKFLVDHAAASEDLRFPFAYMPLDNPILRVEEPFTLIAEMRRQLELLHPDRADLFARFDDKNIGYRGRRRALDERALQGTRQERAGALQETDLTLYEEFAELANGLCARDAEAGVAAPFLMVLDSFEEAQYRGAERLIGLMRMLSALHRMCGSLRIVICTRPPFITAIPPELGEPVKLELQELSRSDARMMLGRMGVGDENLAEAIAKQVGGNPLNLRLAARLVEHEAANSRGIVGLQTTSWMLFSASTETIRGQLYARILDHIHNADVRALAHPGMVLRRVTPELIRDVLAEPCGVEVPTFERATELFDELAREHTLLEPAEGRALRYRTDIRQATLKLLEQDRPAKVREIHEAAVLFYSAIESDTVARAEELYHRLALNEDQSVLAQRWDPLAASSLLGSLTELRPRAQAWLAARVGVDPPAGAREQASIEEWEQLVGRKVRDLLRYNEPEQALKLLSERTTRIPASPLYSLEAKALMSFDRFDEAQRVLQHGIDSISQAPNRGRLAEMLWLHAQVLERRGEIKAAAQVLARAEDIAATIADPLCRLQILVQQILLRRDRRAKFTEDDTLQLRERLAMVVGRVPDGDLDRERSLTRTALLLLGPAYITEFSRGVRAVGVGPIDRTARNDIASRLALIQPDNATRREALYQSLRETAELVALIDDLRHGDTDVTQLIERCLKIPEARSAVAPALVDILKKQPHSLAAANLVGIDEYREPWELELSPEAA